ncbi:MAG: hypothetical protein J0I29_07235, partial [Rhizobiales bacterium]|nr:hypothetical protein [Hyphomicrobiales bacterium]
MSGGFCRQGFEKLSLRYFVSSVTLCDGTNPKIPRLELAAIICNDSRRQGTGENLLKVRSNKVTYGYGRSGQQRFRC